MKLLVCVIFVAIASVQARVGGVCKTESECDPGECCQILSLFPIMSRRQLVSITDLQADRTGTCELYKTEGEPCSGFDKPNGYCSCGPGLQCHLYEVAIADVQTAQPPLRRSMIAPRPGYTWRSECWSLDKISQP